MLKIKTTAYVNLHRTKDKIQKERNLVAVLLAGQLDDLKPFMLAEDLAKAEKYEANLNQNVNDLVNTTFELIKNLREKETTRKEFALNFESEVLQKQIVFHFWDKDSITKDDVYADVMKRLTDACEQEQKFEKLRPILLKQCEW